MEAWLDQGGVRPWNAMLPSRPVLPASGVRVGVLVSTTVGVLVAEMLGVDDYIRKPFAMDKLMDSVERLLAS